MRHKLIWFSLVNEEFCGENDGQRADSDYLSVQWRLLDYLRDFEVLDPRWVPDLQRWRKALYGEGPAVYLERKKRFLAEARAWETEYEQILVYFLFVYFCGAVYDGDALRKAKMAGDERPDFKRACLCTVDSGRRKAGRGRPRPNWHGATPGTRTL